MNDKQHQRKLFTVHNVIDCQITGQHTTHEHRQLSSWPGIYYGGNQGIWGPQPRGPVAEPRCESEIEVLEAGDKCGCLLHRNTRKIPNKQILIIINIITT